ncbi:hypothetical protein [Bacillus cytotoxicus]|nr:hypothetical protein [Bacillus cytotoxicus]MDH2860061.1 hypothetical protein [Bacillus cytotoxicus]MDH2869538.1 hypothetical protein [Bacillus cytotoxicus]MDH2873752.1 hypothetical protein [Bacillus cytotoxicus]MDH2876453.1 hypothetical protein [Bacillus cytotoxicus]MDH2892352.1 hypothetical protein [Bacillus cytotoxicus]
MDNDMTENSEVCEGYREACIVSFDAFERLEESMRVCTTSKYTKRVEKE